MRHHARISYATLLLLCWHLPTAGCAMADSHDNHQDLGRDVSAPPASPPTESIAFASVHTKRGMILLSRYVDVAPETVARVKALANNGFYDGKQFNRVIDGFTVMLWDEPSDNGTLPLEVGKRTFREGSVGMGRAARPNSGDWQFFISFGASPHLDGQYTLFGQVIDGMDIVRDIKQGDAIVSMRVSLEPFTQ